jgi:EAL domain-containing protein (putative c-di-GMP-specific phosphodiesterase class I)
VLGQLTDLGIGISLDDFGTGYSSLMHLKTLPVRELKLDRSFVGHMLTDPTDAAIVSATIELAHQLGIGVVAEGVEDEPTCAALNRLGCERIQGYLLGRPLPARAIDKLLGSTALPKSEPTNATGPEGRRDPVPTRATRL